MKNIPIVILNRDRLYPLIEQVEALHKRNYNNITIIDNQSTYPPLLDWYKKSGVDVFYNNITENSCHAFRDLVYSNHPKFKQIVSDWYVFNDSDIIPVNDVPEDFIEHLIGYAKKYNKSKVGMSIKIDDIDLDYPLNKWVHEYESSYLVLDNNLYSTTPPPTLLFSFSFVSCLFILDGLLLSFFLKTQYLSKYVYS
jgi:hypothetical protein